MKSTPPAKSPVVTPADRRRVTAEVVRRLQQILKTVDLFSRRTLREFGVSGPQIWALRTIWGAGSLTTGELAERMYLHISTVSGVIDRLEDRLLVTRERSDDDRRVVRLRVTRRGRAIILRAPEPPRSLIAKGLQRLKTEELAQMALTVRRLSRIMGAESTDPGFVE